MYYLILEKLTPVSLTDCLNNKHPYVAILTPEEWRRHHDLFDMDIDMEFNIDVANSTKAEVNSDSLTGTFKIPDRKDLLGQAMDFSFALDERGFSLSMSIVMLLIGWHRFNLVKNGKRQA